MLEVQFFGLAETQPELLAHHYTEAGFREHAVGYWQQAGSVRSNVQPTRKRFST